VYNILKELKPLALCVVETHITDDISENEYFVEGYKFVQTKSHSRHTGGCGVYIRDDIKILQVNEQVLERNTWYLTLKVKLVKKVIKICAVYHSPSSSHSDFLVNFSDWLESISERSIDTVIAADLNINMNKVSYYSQRLSNLIAQSDLKVINNFATRITNKSSTKIDLIISNINNIECCTADEHRVADHDTILCSFSTPKINIHTQNNVRLHHEMPRLIKLYKNIDFDELNLRCAKLKFNVQYDEYDQSADQFITGIKDCINQIVPTKYVGTSQKSLKPWLQNQEVFEARNMRNQQWKQFRYYSTNLNNVTTNSEQDKQHLWREYVKARNVYTNIRKKAERQYLEGKIDECRDNSKLMWKTLKHITSTTANTKSDCLKNVKFDNTDPNVSVANKLNMFLIDSIQELEQSIPEVANYDLFEKIKEITPSNISLSNFKKMSMQDLVRITKNLKQSATCDEISVDTFKKIFPSISENFVNLINESIASGKVPASWKKSTIIGIPKVDNPEVPQDIRPINILAIYEKILEIWIHEQLSDYFESHKLLYIKQFGFRKYRSTQTALQMIFSQWRNGLNNNKFVLAVSLDLKRAFETVSRPILLQKLKHYGIRGQALKWLENYLQDRTQVVNINGELSDPLTNNIGVPQGSVLAALLYIIYINDIGSFVNNCVVVMYADDTMLYIIADNLTEAIRMVNDDLKIVMQYFEANKLKCHPDKSNCIIITSSAAKRDQLLQNCNNKINIDGKDFDFQDFIKYLGVIVDYLLNFKEHIIYISKKIAKKTGYMQRISWKLSKWVRQIVYNTIVAPHFQYCPTIFMDINKCDLNTLQKLQNRGLRATLQCGRLTHRRDMLEELKWLSVEQQINYSVLSFIHQVLHNEEYSYFDEFYKLNSDIHNHHTRAAQDFYMPTQNKSCAQKSLFVNGLKKFNSLPANLKLDNITKSKFQSEVKKWVITKYPLV
jgi:hypothetical protein